MTALPPELILLQAVTGLALGAVFVLLSVGLSLIFGLMRVVNFAHGAFFMLGAYAGAFAMSIVDNFWVALIVVPLVIGGCGLVIERVLVRRLYGRHPDMPILLTFGLAMVVVEAVRMVFGAAGLPFATPPALAGAVDLEIGFFPLYRLFVIAATAVILSALWLFLKGTSLGLVIRVGARDPEILAILGIDFGRIRLLVFGLGLGLAGLAGVLAAPMRGVTPDMGVTVLVEAFIVTVVGGMGSLMGGVIAGLSVGMAVAVTSLFAPEAAQLSMFALMAAVLIVKPNGLLGRANERGVA